MAKKYEGLISKVCSKCGEDVLLDGYYELANPGPNSTPYGRALQPCKSCRVARSTELRETPERKREVRDSNLKRLYGIGVDEYDEMCKKQSGLCAICSKPPSGTNSRNKYLHVDHCHETGSVRKLLCHMCNTGLGAFRDNPDLLQKAIVYLRG